MPGQPFLSIVIPAYNEEPRLGGSLSRLGEYLKGTAFDAEVIVVDDGSQDATSAAAVRVPSLTRMVRVVRNPGNRGKGYSIRHGFFEARGTWVLFSDADFSTPIEDFEKLYQRATTGGYDIVIGSRALPESNVEVTQPFHRRFAGQTFNRLVRWMTGLKIHDTQCGFKLMAREKLQPLFEKMVVDRFAFDVELLYLASKAGLSIAEEPVTWRNSPVSRVGLFRDSANMFLDVARIVRRFKQGGYRSGPPEPQR